MDIAGRVLGLVTEALDQLDKTDCRLSAVIRKCTRIAFLRNDYDNFWLEEEMITLRNSQQAQEQLRTELAPHYSKDAFNAMVEQMLKMYKEERQFPVEVGSRVKKGSYCGSSIEEIEHQIDDIEAFGAAGAMTSELHLLKREYQTILTRVRQRVHGFLSASEKQLLQGRLRSDYFERDQQYVKDRLDMLSPVALEELEAAQRCLDDGDREGRSYALLSCRRALKSLADNLYPPRDESVVTTDGREHELTEDKYVNRLWQYITDRVKGHASGELLLADVVDLGNRVDKVYKFSCKGAHAQVSESEANQCVIRTYLIIGDILRLADGDSAIDMETMEIKEEGK